MSDEIPGHEDAAWFFGTLPRKECEDLLMKHGKDNSFVVRESTSQVRNKDFKILTYAGSI